MFDMLFNLFNALGQLFAGNYDGYLHNFGVEEDSALVDGVLSLSSH